MTRPSARYKARQKRLLRKLHLQHLKRIDDLLLEFEKSDGSTRKWTVIIGRNGTAKTTILQAVGLAAAGAFRANSLVENIRESLPDKRVAGAAAEIEAEFRFGPVGQRYAPAHPALAGSAWWQAASGKLGLRSHLRIPSNQVVQGSSTYVDGDGNDLPSDDPLVEAREENLGLWFVAGYGVDRRLPQIAQAPVRPPLPSIDRIRPLFEPWDLLGPNFEGVLDDGLWQKYASLLKKVLFRTNELVPGIIDLELRGRRSARAVSDLMLSHRFVQRAGGEDLKLPATWLSHGYQSVLAWVSDLVGQITLEAGSVLDPGVMEGLVLIDEIDLYLHPSWQVGLVQALRETFREIQFVVTTHSPIFLTAFRREEVVVLDFDAHGNVVQVDTPRDPRLMTATELYEWFFGIDRLYPSDWGDKLDTYSHIAANPFHTDEEHDLASKLREDLEREGIPPGIPLAKPRRAVGS